MNGEGRLKEILTAPGLSLMIQEVLYGFIMSLIFVYATRFGLLHYNSTTDFLLVVTGMNVTWGAIDGIVFYFLGVCDQKRYTKIISDHSVDRETRVRILMDEFSATPLDVMSDEDLRIVCEKMLDRELQSEEKNRKDRRAMALSSVGCFLITVLTLIPIALPILLIEDFMSALMVSTFLSSIILFFIGYEIAPYLGTRRLTTGLLLLGISMSLAIISVFTGG